MELSKKKNSENEQNIQQLARNKNEKYQDYKKNLNLINKKK